MFTLACLSHPVFQIHSGMSEEQKSATVRAVDGYIGLNDFAVHFEDDVAAYFTKHLGEKEFSSICKLSCQAPP